MKEGDAVVDVTLVGPETPGAQKQALEDRTSLVGLGLPQYQQGRHQKLLLTEEASN